MILSLISDLNFKKPNRARKDISEYLAQGFASLESVKEEGGGGWVGERGEGEQTHKIHVRLCALFVVNRGYGFP